MMILLTLLGPEASSLEEEERGREEEEAASIVANIYYDLFQIRARPFHSYR